MRNPHALYGCIHRIGAVHDRDVRERATATGNAGGRFLRQRHQPVDSQHSARRLSSRYPARREVAFLFIPRQKHGSTRPGLPKPSKPVTDAPEDIALLRRLAQMPDSGIIVGDVTRPIWNDNKWQSSVPVPNQKIVAKRESNGTEYAALTNRDGHYEFAPLPLGFYELNPNTVQGLLAVGKYAEVQSRSCSQVGFQLLPDSTISGRVTTSDGKPAKYVQVAIVPTSAGNLQFDSAIVDEDGYFEIKGAQPGRYLLGVGIQARQGSRQWRSRVYYPGAQTTDAAVVIELGQAEKRTTINFQLPNSVTPVSRPDRTGRE